MGNVNWKLDFTLTIAKVLGVISPKTNSKMVMIPVAIPKPVFPSQIANKLLVKIAEKLLTRLFPTKRVVINRDRLLIAKRSMPLGSPFSLINPSTLIELKAVIAVSEPEKNDDNSNIKTNTNTSIQISPSNGDGGLSSASNKNKIKD